MALDPKAAVAVVPPKLMSTEYPIIDTDPHVRRVFGYARNSDYAVSAGMAALSPFAIWLMQKWQPVQSNSPSVKFMPKAFRTSGFIGLLGGLHILYQRSCNRFYGFTENKREVEMDMREMVDKVKQGEPLYGKSSMSTYLQGVAARNSRYSQLFIQVVPWANFANHDQHGVDTAKYYQQAERELEAERLAKAGSA